MRGIVPETARWHSLPAELSSFVGREQELAKLAALLPMTRLLTLVGPGGVGKTRLALRLATEAFAAYPEGVYLVQLAALADPTLVPIFVAAALDVREQVGHPVLASVLEVLRPKRALLVLDNCEHLVAACADLAATLLQACPDLRIVATSREPLSITGERARRVPPLAVPEPQATADLAQLDQYEAVRLFVERAMTADRGFVLTNQTARSAVGICRRLDGIPLAIELAAAYVRVLAVEQIAARLDDCFAMLVGGSRTAPPRHQTLHATIDWSHDLLSMPERVLFRRLAPFAGGWTLEAAEAVCSGDGIDGQAVLRVLTGLVDKSLVLVEPSIDGSVAVRYRLLETLRQYARERLGLASEAAHIDCAHAEFFLGLAERAAPELRGPGQVAWMDRLEREHDNMRTALQWAIREQAGDVGLRLGAALWRLWYVRGHLAEGHAWLVRLLALSTPADSARAAVLNGAGNLAWA